jgi:hypothetical protein
MSDDARGREVGEYLRDLLLRLGIEIGGSFVEKNDLLA